VLSPFWDDSIDDLQDALGYLAKTSTPEPEDIKWGKILNSNLEALVWSVYLQRLVIRLDFFNCFFPY
jgi:hypothetical protein